MQFRTKDGNWTVRITIKKGGWPLETPEAWWGWLLPRPIVERGPRNFRWGRITIFEDTEARQVLPLSLSHTYAHLLSLSRVFLCHAISPRLRSESSSRFSLFPDPLERLITLILLPFPIILVENEDTGAWERSYLLKSRGEYLRVFSDSFEPEDFQIIQSFPFL